MFPFNFEAQYSKLFDEHSAELTVASKVEFYEVLKVSQVLNELKLNDSEP